MRIFPALTEGRSKEFFNAFDVYAHNIYDCVKELRKTIHFYADGKYADAKMSAKKVTNLENKADYLRRDMEKTLYSGVLIPFGREDKYNLIEAIDDIADKAEIIVRLAGIEQPKIPKKLVTDLKVLADLVEKTTKKLLDAVILLDTDIQKSIETAKQVELLREKVRTQEFQLLGKLIGGNVTFSAILLKELITLTAQVADKAEEAADRVVALAVKYQI